MWRRRSKVRLAVGVGASRKVSAFVLSLPFVVTAGVLLWAPLYLIVESVTESPVDLWGSLLPHLFVSAGFLLGVYLMGAVSLAIVAVIPYAVWLDGTMLGERLWFRTRWVDLSTADIDAEDDRRRDIVSLLVRTGHPVFEVRLPLHGMKSRRPEQLVALADAITGTRVRQGTEDAAFIVAERIRRLAS
ncbi:hypothetical protein TPA0907_26640 [Micromonospora humidisoli]|uniref:PH domain-containing protein n=1 Tax=Micromonospora humidisoli TaxID=2807622 RepID=A0ABS2JEX1_9ACTN|nr:MULTISPECIES: hypothetical protein [Micromonospora]MBM7085048.1 hypothetical protein [Micromonospora humidisoli]GHJ08297.1 hypothetical protein TPA0907_26640 [Micromonospora sp. AKA109]